MTSGPSDADDWRRLQAAFSDALALAADDRAAHLQALAARDPDLHARLLPLLAADRAGDDTVRHAISAQARRVSDAASGHRVGHRLGPWQLVAHIADGGMGAVYRAERADGQYRQTVAVKLLHPAFADAASAERMARERQILAGLVHPHIARLLDGGTSDDGVPYLVMEYIDGEPIDRWCWRQHDLRLRLQLFVQVCGAVEHAHRNLVVHRDLKPSNILVDASGAPKLLDFGIATLLAHEGARQAGIDRLLTPAHASPEQLQGRPITTATDVYALGVLLHLLLSGQLPHETASRTPQDLARAVIEDPPTRPSAATQPATGGIGPRQLTGDLDHIVQRALQKDPAQRYASVADLAADIERHLSHRLVRARPVTWWLRPAKALQRHPVAWPASVITAVVVLAGSVAFTARLADERDRALAAERSAQRAATFTASLLNSTAADAGGSRAVSVRELLTRAVARVRTELESDPALAARLRLALAGSMNSWGAYDEARAELQRALAQLDALPPADAQRTRAEVLSLMSSVTHDLGRLDDSLEEARQAEQAWAASGDRAGHARSLYHLAVSLNAVRRRTDAEPVFRQALAAQRAVLGDDHLDVAATLNDLAWCLHAMGRLDEAGPLYEASVAMQRRVGAPDTDVFLTLNNLAGLHWDRGRVDEAERRWREVRDIVVRLYGADGHAAVARAYHMLSLVATERGQFDDALALAEQAVAVNRAQVGERHRWTARVLAQRGAARLGLGQLAAAEDDLQRALAITRQVLPAGHVDQIPALRTLARVALQRQRPAQAERLARDALGLIDAMPSPDRVQRDRVEWLLARALVAQGRADDARRYADLALQRRRDTMPPDHPHRLALEAARGLPPYADTTEPQAAQQARQTLKRLQVLLGPQAPLVIELQQLLDPLSG